jgi:hypothetical protein
MNLTVYLRHPALACFALLTWLFFSGCNGPCKDVACNNGECVNDGECVCNSGYEGSNCDISNNQKFDGNFTLTEICTGSTPAPYPVSLVVVAGTPNQFELSGLYGQSTVLRARVEDDGVEFIISRQAITGGKELESLAGTISIDAKTINLSYQVYQGSDTLDRCAGSMVK